MLDFAILIARAIYIYLGSGFLYGIWFAFRTTKDVPVKGVFTRLMFVPGAALIWPYLLLRKARS